MYYILTELERWSYASPFGVLKITLWTSDAAHWTTRFNICPAIFWASFDWIVPCDALILLFWNKNVSIISADHRFGSYF